MLKNFFMNFPRNVSALWEWILEKLSKVIQLTSPEFGASYLLSFLMLLLFAYLFNTPHTSSDAEAFWAALAILAMLVFLIMTIVLIYFALVEWFKKISRNY